jgi:RNA polymerase-interacting CarD/CdnL/TRCF family regulator
VDSEERPVFGRKQRCLKIRFDEPRRTVFLQEDAFVRSHIRPVMAKSVLPEVYRLLKSRGQYGQHKPPRLRLERYRTKAEIADPMSLAEVARDLSRRSKRHRLNETERELQASAVELLADEIAMVEQREREKIRTKLERILTG